MPYNYKPKRLIYVPIEAYKSRSTEYMSVQHGVYETQFDKLKIPFKAIRPNSKLHVIERGQVVDVLGRTNWGHAQVEELIFMMREGEISQAKGDVIYFEDMWTPGFEMIPYAQHILFGNDTANHIRCYAFCHAQSTDPFDFTAPMAWWMRHFERGWMTYLSGLTVACKEMVHQFEDGGLTNALSFKEKFDKVAVCGLAFDSSVLLRLTHLEPVNVDSPRAKTVVFSSRWDKEKNPEFYLDLAEAVAADGRDDIQFVIATGLRKLTSNSDELLKLLKKYASTRDNMRLFDGLSKREYFTLLRKAKVQFNCASQDFISYSLLDAALNGCIPLYPEYLTFPDALDHRPEYLYQTGNLQDAKKKLYALIDGPNMDVSWICRKYESSVKRMVKSMGFSVDG